MRVTECAVRGQPREEDDVVPIRNIDGGIARRGVHERRRRRATPSLSTPVFVTASSGRSPAVHRRVSIGIARFKGVINADMVAMCAFGMPFSNNFKVVNVSGAKRD